MRVLKGETTQRKMFDFRKYDECLKRGCSRKEIIGFVLHIILTNLMVVEFIISHVTVVLSFQRECHCEYCVSTPTNSGKQIHYFPEKSFEISLVVHVKFEL